MPFTWSQEGVYFRRNSAVTLEAETTLNTEYSPNVKICVEPIIEGFVISATETTTPLYAVTGDTATFSLTIFNDTGGTLTSLVLNNSHNGGGSISFADLPFSIDAGESIVMDVSYYTLGDINDVTLTLSVTGTNLDTTTTESNVLLLLVEIDPLVTEPPEEPPP
jgi:hypothetical protein